MSLGGIIPDKVISFIAGIGITVEPRKIEEKTFLPGFRIRGATLTVDPGVEGFQPGDVLHESAHIALCDPEKRPTLAPKDLLVPAQEIACHAWCWAALNHLELDPKWVFHNDYKAGGDWLIDVLSSGQLMGQPLLQYWGLTGRDGVEWPGMISWVREEQ